MFTVINVAGLAVGLAACLLITLYVQNETSYDEHWEKADRIYRVTTTLDRTGAIPCACPPILETSFVDQNMEREFAREGVESRLLISFSLLTNLIAWPVAVWAMLSWLQRFPYRLDALALIPLCVLAGAITLSIAWLTVAGNTVRVARRNPVYVLRYE